MGHTTPMKSKHGQPSALFFFHV